ncbi:MAG: hypothetical protein Q4A05_00030 [Ruminococcus sp.]|nr:hypothetical protein [Ruminococcus sp.]
MSKLKERFKNTPTKNKIRFVAAVLVTCTTIAYVPTLAWFSNQRQIVKLQRVESPNVLYLTAAHRQDSKFLEVTGIDTDEGKVDSYLNPIMATDDPSVQAKIDHKDYAICVTGDSISQFMIQIAYTTNNPFTYELYAADEKTDSEMVFPEAGEEPDFVAVGVKGNSVVGDIIENELKDAEYHTDVTAPEDDDDEPAILYYKINSSLSGTTNGKYPISYLNLSDNGRTANNAYLDESYGSYSNMDDHAKPVYAQITGLDAFTSNSGGNNANNKKPFSRHFILRVKWDDTLNNKSKETDIVYITVKATS